MNPYDSKKLNHVGMCVFVLMWILALCCKHGLLVGIYILIYVLSVLIIQEYKYAMDQLKTLILNKLSRQYENIQTVSATLDLKLLSIHDRNNILHIFTVKASSNVLSISNTETWVSV